MGGGESMMKCMVSGSIKGGAWSWVIALNGRTDNQDLFYWTFYPYNLGKLVGTLGWLGNRGFNSVSPKLTLQM
jgi:hypothetical protein